MGREKERVLGNHLAADLRREMPPLSNASLPDYVLSVVQRLGAVEYSYELLDSSRKPDVTEPMPLPGGHILIPSAAFLAAAGEAEFAALLAHAAGHLAAWHATRAMKNPSNREVVPLLYPGSLHQDSRGRAVVMISSALRSMQDERERGADARAVEILTRAGYDASALHTYLKRTLEAGEAPTAPRLA
ncbi:MAG: hypothetical protein FJW31_15290 [Acidobacteria bacterium]|nr:hypothetical protein [Acidobacteriota bacterium]